MIQIMRAEDAVLYILHGVEFTYDMRMLCVSLVVSPYVLCACHSDSCCDETARKNHRVKEECV